MEHRNHRTQQIADCGALGGTLPVGRPPGTTPVTQRYLRETEKSTPDHGTNYVALARIIGTRQIWLWKGVVRGTSLEWWGTDRWNRSLVVVRLTDVLRVVVIFHNHSAHSECQLVVDERAGVDRIVNW